MAAMLASILRAANSDSLPFSPGEKLTYRVSWSNVIEAGTAELTVTPSPKVAGALKLELRARTAPALGAGYSFSDDFVSHFQPSLGAPSLFEKNFTERKRVVKEQVTFNQVHRLANYTNSKKQSKQVSIELGTQDPISVLYALRSLGLKPGVQISLPVLDGGRLYSVEAKVAGTELITTKMGSFSASRVEISIQRDASKLGDRKVTVWFTNDARRVPVLASVALPVGAGIVELTAQAP
jgi:hypothetical protein